MEWLLFIFLLADVLFVIVQLSLEATRECVAEVDEHTGETKLVYEFTSHTIHEVAEALHIASIAIISIFMLHVRTSPHLRQLHAKKSTLSLTNNKDTLHNCRNGHRVFQKAFVNNRYGYRCCITHPGYTSIRIDCLYIRTNAYMEIDAYSAWHFRICS